MRHDLQSKPLYRLLYALKPTLRIARQTDHFADTLGMSGHRVRPEHQHVTLAITADHPVYPYEAIKALQRARSGVRAEPFDLPLDRLSFSNRSAALRPSRKIPPLHALQREIVAAMGGQGIGLRPDWSFRPHQTLFYREGRPETRRVDGFTWRVEQFLLLCSHVGRTRHEILGTWPLKGDGQYSLF